MAVRIRLIKKLASYLNGIDLTVDKWGTSSSAPMQRAECCSLNGGRSRWKVGRSAVLANRQPTRNPNKRRYRI
jgi:hypothetical protein